MRWLRLWGEVCGTSANPGRAVDIAWRTLRPRLVDVPCAAMSNSSGHSLRKKGCTAGHVVDLRLLSLVAVQMTEGEGYHVIDCPRHRVYALRCTCELQPRWSTPKPTKKLHHTPCVSHRQDPQHNQNDSRCDDSGDEENSPHFPAAQAIAARTSRQAGPGP